MAQKNLNENKALAVERDKNTPKQKNHGSSENVKKNIDERGKKIIDERTRIWTFIIYPDSVPYPFEIWLEMLKRECGKGAISPLHDADLNGDGLEKKPHWHIVLVFEGKKSFSQIKAIADKFNSPRPEKVNSLSGMCRYLCHIDNPEKAQYDFKDAICWGGLNIEKEIFSASDFKELLECKIIDLIEDNDIREYYHLIHLLRQEIGNASEEFRYATNHTVFLNAYIKSRKFVRAEQNQITPPKDKEQ